MVSFAYRAGLPSWSKDKSGDSKGSAPDSEFTVLDNIASEKNSEDLSSDFKWIPDGRLYPNMLKDIVARLWADHVSLDIDSLKFTISLVLLFFYRATILAVFIRGRGPCYLV